MRALIRTIDRFFTRLSRGQIVFVAAFGVGVVAMVDYLTGYRVSVSVFYLVPLAVAAWYGGTYVSIGIAILACISWFIADVAAGRPYEGFTVPIWNVFVRLGFLLVNGLVIVALRDALSRQRELASTDPLTGAFSRRAFEERLGYDLERARHFDHPLTLVFVDLDNFKDLNDTRGHPTGDQALRDVVRVLKSTTRRADTVARLGGDEFAVVVPDTDRRGAEEVVEKLRRHLQEMLAAATPAITCSIGTMTFEHIPHDVGQAVRATDALLYEAKRRGKNCVVFDVAPKIEREVV